MGTLTITGPNRQVRVSDGGTASFGRDPASTIPLIDERVSRRHGLVRSERGEWIYEDLASSNGSFVAGARVSRLRIRGDMTIQLGNPVAGPAIRLQVEHRRNSRWAAWISVVAALALLFGVGVATDAGARFMSSTAPSPTSSASPSAPLTRTDIVAAGKAATVLIVQANSQGSGVYLGNDRVLTALHVVPSSAIVNVSLNDRLVGRAQVIATDENDDLAMLLVPGLSAAGARPVSWGASDKLREGDELVVLGYPAGLPFSVKVGVVSGLREDHGTKLIQTDASLNPGMSGGPALDPSGALVGITDFGYPRYPGLNFLVASATAQAFANQHH